jgi:hypothetical protein
MKFSGVKFLVLLTLSTVALWAWKRANTPPPTLIRGFVLTADGNKPIKGAWVVPAAYLEKSVLHLNDAYIIDYTSGCGPAVAVPTDANGQFLASIPDEQIHIDKANTSIPGIAYVYALGFETVTMHPTSWKSPILMKPTGLALNDVIHESKKLAVGPCAIGGKRYTADSAMGAVILEQKITRFCALPTPSIEQLNALDMGLIGACELKKSNASARSCLQFNEMIRAVRSKSGYGPISSADRQTACHVTTEFLTEVTND